MTSSPPSSSSLPQTFQLPDTLNIISPLELSANPHCHPASNASAAFISNLGLPDLNSLLFPSQNEKENGKDKDKDPEEDQTDKLKLGLLASLIFPRADLPQLVLLIDFIQLLVWSCLDGSVHNSNSTTTHETGRRGLDVLHDHPYFQHLSTRLKRYPRSSSQTWQKRFQDSFTEYRNAQKLIHASTNDNTSHPNELTRKWMDARNQPSKPRIGMNTCPKSRNDALDSHLKFRRNMYGVDMIMCIAELVEVIPAFDALPDDEEFTSGGWDGKEKRGDGTLLSDTEMRLVHNAKEHAVDFIGVAMDALSFRYLHLNNLPNPLFVSAAGQDGASPTPSFSVEDDRSPTTATDINPIPNINPYLPHTFIPHIMIQNHLSLQGSMNHSVTLLNSQFQSFRNITHEKGITQLVENETESVRRITTGGGAGAVWGIGDKVLEMMRLLGASHSENDIRRDHRDGSNVQTKNENDTTQTLHHRYLSSHAQRHRQGQLKAYIHSLEDMMVGSVHWAYESELFFGGGNKGTEVRTFGWVFG